MGLLENKNTPLGLWVCYVDGVDEQGKPCKLKIVLHQSTINSAEDITEEQMTTELNLAPSKK